MDKHKTAEEHEKEVWYKLFVFDLVFDFLDALCEAGEYEYIESRLKECDLSERVEELTREIVGELRGMYQN